MKYIVLSSLILCFLTSFGQEESDSTKVYKKRVLESTEIDFISSYYQQDGDNASVTGGIGDEHLTDFASSIIIALPLNDDDVLTFDAGISAYTSASSSNGNPFDTTGASGGHDDDDDDDDDEHNGNGTGEVTGTPWNTSTGASRKDTWSTASVDYSHSSDDRDFSWNVNSSFANEYDYNSIGFGAGLLKQFNEKNTSVGLSTRVYLDEWRAIYPTELKSYYDVNGNLNQGFFEGVTVLDQNGTASTSYSPLNGFEPVTDEKRNSYSASLSFSQILSKNAQISVFADLVSQQGLLSNPLQRVYFADSDNYYIGNGESIANYTSSSNQDVFQLADDIERLPDSRMKLPIGMRLNYFVSENLTLRSYYRYYTDDWGMTSNTVSLEAPIKVNSFTFYPSFRYYNQSAIDYFKPYETALSTDEYYTSDYDLSEFNSSQIGLGVSYTDIFTKAKVWKIGLKSIDAKAYHYNRNSNFNSTIGSIGFKFVMD